MDSKIVILETVQICNTCGRKIPKGKQAVKVADSEVYFCNKHCICQKIEEKFKELNRNSLLVKKAEKERFKTISVPKEGIKNLLENEAIKTEEKLTKDDRKDLIAYLEEYLKIFKNKKVHAKAHKKKPCMTCNRAEELLKKLEKMKC